MPELPEVETVVRDLRPLLVGRTIRAVAVGDRKLRQLWQPEWTAKLQTQSVTAIRRRGKWILVDLRSGSTLLVHLGMTGQFRVHPAHADVEDHTHVRFALTGNEELRFRDIRRFGSVTLFESQSELDDYLNARLGPEPFGVDPALFRAKFLSTSRSLKAALLDQTLIAGVGNIYADESCFLTGLHPGMRANTLTPAQCEDLRLAVERVLTNAIEGRGSTIRNYVGGSGLKGTYQTEFNVYGRTGQPCPRCATLIQVTTLAGRSSHFCETCQPLPRRRTKKPSPRS